MPLNKGNRESGNIFVYVLIGIVLFAALMFAFARGSRQSGGNITQQQAALASSDMMSYAQRMARAANRIMAQGDMSEGYISFENDEAAGAGYTNADCNGLTDPDSCKVFNSAGGAGGRWIDPPPNINDGSTWIFTGSNRVPGVGNDANADLVMLLPGVTAEACKLLNEQLRVPNPGDAPPVDADGIDQTKFTGSFANAAIIGTAADLNGVNAACVNNGGNYVFYAVLMDR